MKIFFDTTVLVAASSASHPHHVQAFPALRRVAAGRDMGFISIFNLGDFRLLAPRDLQGKIYVP